MEAVGHRDYFGWRCGGVELHVMAEMSFNQAFMEK